MKSVFVVLLFLVLVGVVLAGDVNESYIVEGEVVVGEGVVVEIPNDGFDTSGDVADVEDDVLMTGKVSFFDEEGSISWVYVLGGVVVLVLLFLLFRYWVFGGN